MTSALAIVGDAEWGATVDEVLGTRDPTEIERRVDGACRAALRSPLQEIFFFALSVGAAFGVVLDDGRRVMVKAYARARPSEFVEAVYRVQLHLAEAGFPAPRPLAPPVRFGPALATAEEWIDWGEPGDPRRAEIRRLLARSLAELVRLTEPFREEEAFTRGFSIVRDRPIWKKPHSPLFDFEATRLGAEWIDALARDAREVIVAAHSRLVVGHSDWSVKHFRFRDGGISVIYDWDSLMLERETFIVGTAAAHFTAAPPDWTPPTPEEAALFVEEYEEARGKRFIADERASVRAALIYGTAYTARCQHALDPEEAAPDGYRATLRLYA